MWAASWFYSSQVVGSQTMQCWWNGAADGVLYNHVRVTTYGMAQHG